MKKVFVRALPYLGILLVLMTPVLAAVPMYYGSFTVGTTGSATFNELTASTCVGLDVNKILQSTTNCVDLLSAQTIGGVKTFSSAPVFNAALGIASGGTGSTTQNFIDLTTAQTANGVKTFGSAPVSANGFTAASSTYGPTSMSVNGNITSLGGAVTLGTAALSGIVNSTNTNALYLNYNTGSGGVQFCNGAGACPSNVSGLGNFNANSYLAGSSTYGATSATVNGDVSMAALGGNSGGVPHGLNANTTGIANASAGLPGPAITVYSAANSAFGFHLWNDGTSFTLGSFETSTFDGWTWETFPNGAYPTTNAGFTKVASLDQSGNLIANGRIRASSNAVTTSYTPPLYTAAGAAVANTAHSVVGTCAFASSTQCAVTLSGAAVFTSATSYGCSGDTGATAATFYIEIGGKTASSFVMYIVTANSFTANYVCTGT